LAGQRILVHPDTWSNILVFSLQSVSIPHILSHACVWTPCGMITNRDGIDVAVTGYPNSHFGLLHTDANRRSGVITSKTLLESGCFLSIVLTSIVYMNFGQKQQELE
jgi:hypothetical protein